MMRDRIADRMATWSVLAAPQVGHAGPQKSELEYEMCDARSDAGGAWPTAHDGSPRKVRRYVGGASRADVSMYAHRVRGITQWSGLDGTRVDRSRGTAKCCEARPLYNPVLQHTIIRLAL